MLLERLEAPAPQALMLDRGDMEEWPSGLFDGLRADGLLRDAAPAEWVECPGCWDGHAEQPVPRGDHFVIYCPEAGIVRLQPEQLLQWSLDVDGFTRLVYRRLGGTGLVRPRVAGRWWTFTSVQLHSGIVDLVVCRGSAWESERDEIARRLNETTADAILLFAGDEIAGQTPRAISLERLFRWEDNSVGIDSRELDRLVQRSRVPSGEQYLLEHRGAGWVAAFGGPEFLLADLKGFGYIARLLSVPGRPISVEELEGATMAKLPVVDGDVLHTESRLPLTDEQTIADVKRGLRSLAENGGLSSEEESESDNLKRYLRSTTRRGGRPRTVGKDENARQRVAKAIDRAIREIGTHSEEMSAHLDRSIEKGFTPVYKPIARFPWRTGKV